MRLPHCTSELDLGLTTHAEDIPISETLPRLNAALDGRYRIERVIGQGGMATVYLAHDERHDRKVALKILRPDLAAVMGSERFLSEIRTTANLQHPHILPLHDSGDADGFLFYVMPYVEGESLRAKLDRDKQLGVDEALRITKAVAAALDYAHRQGVIHRDVKPANVLLHDGEPLVADFGIALAVSAAGGGRLTETGLSLGTPYYMSPEQASADREPGPQSDVYSLACMLYEMLVGDPPHTGSSAQAVLAKILTERPRAVTELRDTVPPHVGAAVAKALERLPADRFDTADAFRAALDDTGFTHEAVMRTTGTPLAATITAPSTRGWMTALPWGIAAVATGVAIWGLKEEPAVVQVTRVALAVPEGQEFSKAAMGPNNHATALSPDGTQLVYRGIGEAGTYQLWRRRLDELVGTPIPGTAFVQNPSFSRDGQSLAFHAEGRGAIGVIPQEGGTAVWIEPASAQFAWGDDGAIYFTARDNLTELRRWTPGAAESELLVGLDSRIVVTDVLPGSQAILADTRPIGPMLAVPTATGEAIDLGEGRRPKYLNTGHIVYRRPDDDVLLVQPFDLRTLSAIGPAVSTSAQVGASGQSGAEYTVAEDGTLVYARGGAGSAEQLVWWTREGREEVVDWIEPGSYEGLALSASGDSVAAGWGTGAQGEYDIWVFDLMGRARLPLTRDGTSVRPQWHPTERRISYIGALEGSASAAANALMSIAVDGSGVPETIVEVMSMPADGWWTHDGSELVLRMRGTSLRSLFRFVPGEDEAPRPWLDQPFNERSPEPSPDGNWLVYVSDQSGRDEVYAQPYPDRGRVVSVSVEGGSQPAWSRDGTEIFWVGVDGYMWSAAVAYDETDFSVGARERLFELDFGLRIDLQRRLYDVAPDGRFLFTRRGEAAAQTQLVLVRNWVHEVTSGGS